MSHRRPPAPILHPLRARAPFASPTTDWSVHRPVHPGAHQPAPANATPIPQHPASSIQHRAIRPRGLTLIEMLVALAVTLVMMAAVVNLFANLSGSIRNRRAMIEAGAQLRQVRQRMQLDLAGATCQGRTWVQPAENQGYIEYVEHRHSDSNPTSLTVGPNGEINTTTSLIPGSQVLDPDSGEVTDARGLGDYDDILALTVRSESDPFSAQYRDPTTNNVQTVESLLAEVLWFAIENPPDNPDTTEDETLASGTRLEPGMRRVYRRALLIAPWLGPWPATGGPGSRPPDGLENVSVRREGNQWIANTLGDLTKRENRVEHRVNWPFEMSQMGSSVHPDRLMLSDVLAFDVRIFDPGAPLFNLINGAPAPANRPGGVVVQPGDQPINRLDAEIETGWLAAVTSGGAAPSGYGAYVDLGWGMNGNDIVWPQGASLAMPLNGLPSGAPRPQFHVRHQAGWHPRNPAPMTAYPSAYDTWSFHYENNGIDEDANFPSPYGNNIDQGTNGLDDDNQYGVDDIGERETAPPYDVPLTGLQVRFRIYEPDARQIREASVTQSFGQ